MQSKLLMIAKKLVFCFILAAVLAANFIALGSAAAAETARPDPAAWGGASRKIVVYNQDISLLANIPHEHLRGLVFADVAELTPSQTAALRADSRVIRVEDDLPVQALGQTVPWGVTRIAAPAAAPSSTGSGVKVAILDTGVDLAHPDLAGQIGGSYNAVSPGSPASDDNGHGTHVAGIIDAANNSIG